MSALQILLSGAAGAWFTLMLLIVWEDRRHKRLSAKSRHRKPHKQLRGETSRTGVVLPEVIRPKTRKRASNDTSNAKHGRATPSARIPPLE